MLARVRNVLRPLVRDVAGEFLFRTGVTQPIRAGRGRLTVVTFHRVLTAAELAEYPLPQIAVTVDELAWFTGFFARNYTCGTLAEVHRRWLGGESPARPFLAVTFDDGQLDNYRNALPVLERAGLRASFFVPVDAVDSGESLWHDRLGQAARCLLLRDAERALELFASLVASATADDPSLVRKVVSGAKRLRTAERLDFVTRVEAALGGPRALGWDGFMSWEQLRTLVRSGHEVGSHSGSHPILPLVDDDQLEREGRGSKARLEGQLGTACESFCYPNGDCDDRVVAAIQRAGYRRAVSTSWGPNGMGADPFLLSRCDMQGVHARSRSGELSEPRLAFRMSRYFLGPRG